MGNVFDVTFAIGMTFSGDYFFKIPVGENLFGGRSSSIEDVVDILGRSIPEKMGVANMWRDFSQLNGRGDILIPYQQRVINLLRKRCDKAICVDGQVYDL